MANIKSQKKRILTNAKRAERNKAVKSDVAAAKGIIHKNQAARRKSRLMKQLNATTAG